jgi:hypothetical protein
VRTKDRISKGSGLRRSPQGDARRYRHNHRRQRRQRGSWRQARERNDSHACRAKKVTIDKGNATVIDNVGTRGDIDARVAQIRQQIDATTSNYDRGKLQEGLAKLTGGIAVIRAGDAAEVEVKEKKDLANNALHATRAAVEKAILPGGGVSLLRALKARDGIKAANDDQQSGSTSSAARSAPPLTRSPRMPASMVLGSLGSCSEPRTILSVDVMALLFAM